MPAIKAAVAVLCTLVVAGCSTSGTTGPGPSGSSASSTTVSASSVPEAPTAGGRGPGATVTFDDADVPAAKEHCEAYVELNRRVHAQGEKDVSDESAWMALYEEASAKKKQAPEKFKGLYAVVQVWTLELSQSKDGSIKPETTAQLGQAIMGNAGVCSAAGVTLPIL